MLKYLWKFLKYLEEKEGDEPSSFWTCTIFVYFIIKSFSFVVLSSASEVPYQSQVIVGQLRAGDSSDRIQKIDSDFHRRLEKYFPDWEERMAYQEKQAEFYKLARRKKSELKKLRIEDSSKFYSEQELDSINYFQGKGYYARYQDIRVAPNIYDTRQSFLLKMQDTKTRQKFLKSFNRINN